MLGFLRYPGGTHEEAMYRRADHPDSIVSRAIGQYSRCVSQAQYHGADILPLAEYDNVLAEITNGLYKTEVIRRRDWRNIGAAEYATLERVDWFNH